MHTSVVSAACTELHLAGRGIDTLAGFEPFTNLECLWLNDNQLQTIHGLDTNFRIKELYVQSNHLHSLRSCLAACKFLSILDVSNNQLHGVGSVTQALSKFHFLKSLNLFGNPCCQEADYRATVLTGLPSLQVLDHHTVSAQERKRAQVRVLASAAV
jgi:Leucine-rich repeat (LRR) protein